MGEGELADRGRGSSISKRLERTPSQGRRPTNSSGAQYANNGIPTWTADISPTWRPPPMYKCPTERACSAARAYAFDRQRCQHRKQELFQTLTTNPDNRNFIVPGGESRTRGRPFLLAGLDNLPRAENKLKHYRTQNHMKSIKREFRIGGRKSRVPLDHAEAGSV